MTDRLPGSVLSGKIKRPKPLITNLLITALVVIIGWAIYSHYHKEAITAKPDQPLTLKQQTTQAQDYASKKLASKDYAAAVQGYINAASTAFYQGDYQQSKKILLECITKVPDANVTWDVYDSLALTAKKLNDTALEKSSLQKAIAKASAPNSGVPKATIDSLNQILQGIK